MKDQTLQSSAVSDAMDRIGIRGVLDGFFPVIKGTSAIGSAMPVFLRRSGPSPKGMREGLIEAIQETPAGSILVLSAESKGFSIWGGLMSWYAKRKGVCGVVVDGAVRDTDEIINDGLPVFSRKVTPVSGYGRLEVASVGRPVQIGSLTVRKEDLVVADSDGIVIIPKAKMSAVLNKILELEKAERQLRTHLQGSSRHVRSTAPRGGEAMR